MTMSIIDYVAEINNHYLAGGCFSLFVLFLWNRALVKRIFKWAFTITTVTAVGLMVQMMLNDGAALPWDKQFQGQKEKEPLVRSTYYRDPLAGTQDLPGK